MVNAPFLRCEEKVYGPEGLQDETSIRPRNLYVYLELVVTEVGEIQRDLDDKRVPYGHGRGDARAMDKSLGIKIIEKPS
eukprot:gene7032-8388_t